MTCLVNPFMIAPAGPTYQDFRNHIAAKATSGIGSWNGTSAYAGKYRSIVTAPAGSMVGTTFNSGARAGLSVPSRMIQHGFPDEASWLAQVAGGLEVYWDILGTIELEDFPSVTRNGYTSSARSQGQGPEATAFLLELIYWDGLAARRMVPVNGLGPDLYTF